MAEKTACVIGAGFAGIAALKESVKKGFKSVCYELDSDIGGVWHRKNYSDVTNTPAIWDTLVTNSSKFNSCYSDFPSHPDDTPYLSAEAMFKYLERAVEHYGLRQHIEFNTRVIKIKKTKDHEETGKWEVFTASSDSIIAGSALAGPRGDDNSLSECRREIFDFIFICTGYFKVPAYPDIPGMDKFKGTISHSFSYESAKPYEGKTVLIVGNKLSAADIGNDIGNRARQVYLALGQGSWIIPRCLSKGRVFDQAFPRSVMHSKDAVVRINNALIEEAESKLDHKAAGIRPPGPPTLSQFGISDDLQLKLLVGKAKAYGRLVRLEDNRAWFQDGQVISGIDVVIFCTGYKPDLSFLDLSIIHEDGKMELYKMIFPLNEKHNTLALIGHTGGDGPKAIFCETQARMATLVMAGQYTLPSQKLMKKDVDFWNANALQRKQKYNSYFISLILLTDFIADEVGFYPTFWKVFLKNPTLAFRTWYGPMISAQFRLVGPDSQWDEAVKTCNTFYEQGSSTLKHMVLSDYHRPDLTEYYKNKAFSFVAVSSIVVAFAGFLSQKYALIKW